MKVYAIIPSGGKGKRLGSDLPKQYLEVHGKSIIAYTLEVFQKCDLVDEIIIPAEPEFFELLEKIKDKYNFSKLVKIVSGGKERQDSVYNALSSISAAPDDFVIVHDAARPLLPLNTLNSGIDAAIKTGSVVIAVKARDTLIKGNQKVFDYVRRDEIYYAQTPQIFRYDILRDAMERARTESFTGTDESMLVKRAGYEVEIIEGSSFNFKITTKSDFEIFTLISRS